MTLLALEFSTQRRSAAVIASHAVTGYAADTGVKPPLPLIQSALAQSGISAAEVSAIAVGTGPGSYTGIRSAIAVAQGWQLARAVQVLAVSTIECLAFQAQESGLRPPVHLVIDAQREEFYLATVEVDTAGKLRAGPLQLVPAAVIREKLAAHQTVAGPDLQTIFPGLHDLVPDARSLAQLAAGRSDFIRAERLEPVYLREITYTKAPPPKPW
jgi:tRNA threonylcarbamoyladenosine biosynthesis protein TsaB